MITSATHPDRLQQPASAVPPLSLMDNPVRGYDWGSPTAIARLQGREPSGAPEAELWMGAHPAAPSALVDRNGVTLSLPDAIAAAPLELLGRAVTERFGARLPFMLKVLGVARPLSVQVHPDAERARSVHALPDSPYGDPHHKPELLVALEPTEALFGFRPAQEAAALLSALRLPRLSAVIADLTDTAPSPRDDDHALPVAEPARLHRALARLVGWPEQDRHALVVESAAAARALVPGADLPEPAVPAAAWVARLAELHPEDPLVLAPMLLDVIQLAPGDGVFVPAGVPHAYLSGCGVEVLAASDNVVRAGLTSKTVAVDELLQIVDSRPRPQCRLSPETVGPREVAWRPDVEDFQLTRIVVDGATPGGEHGVPADPSVTGPQIVLCTRGEVTVHTDVTVAAGSAAPFAADDAGVLRLPSGRSAFVSAAAGPLSFSGSGEIYRAAVGAGHNRS